MQNTSDELKEAVIDSVREHPCLYNKSNKDYKDKIVKENAWTSISQKLGKNGMYI